MRSIHPGEILHHEFLVPMGITAAQLAERLGVPSHDLIRTRATLERAVATPLQLQQRGFG